MTAPPVPAARAGRRRVLALGIAAGAGALGAGVAWWRLRPTAPSDQAVTLLFAQSLPDAQGNPLALSGFAKRPLILNFWATWCPPCVAEAPELVETYKKYHERGLEIIGISLDQNRAALDKFTKENGMTWPQYFDGKGWDNDLAQRFKIQSVPTLWLFGKDGKLTDASARGERLHSLIENALAAE